MAWDASKYLMTRDVKEVELKVCFACKKCGRLDLSNEKCTDHNVLFDTMMLKIRALPWFKRTQISSTCLTWTSDGLVKFDRPTYIGECLKYMVVEAPWGPTNDIFLASVGNELGSALEALTPSAFTTPEGVQTVDEIKKEF